MKPTDDRGFTLVEVLIAMIILTIALVSLAEMMAITLRAQLLGRNETAAVRLAQSKIDELIAVDFTGTSAALVAVGGSVTSNVTNYNDTPEAGYTRRWQIEAIGTETSIRKLTVRIVPPVSDRRTSAQVELTTFIRDP